MLKTVRYIMMFLGLGMGTYGALKDFDPLTLAGAFVFVVALMLNVIINAFKK
ncbi:MAG: hypothetical protein NVS9B7_05790 [Flavisolibacter sp.]